MVTMKKVLEDWTAITEEQLLENIDFTTEEISDLLISMGLINGREKCREEDLERYIFLYGNDQEIYGADERSFIEGVGSVYIYDDISRKTNRGTIATKIFAADLCQFEDGVRSCFFFMKIINKANDGFNIFLFRTGDGFFVGCRLYDKDIHKNCTLTEAIRFEEQLEELMDRLISLPSTEEFIPFYSSLVEAIEYRDIVLLDYDLKIKLKRGINFTYLDMLSDVENVYHINLGYAKEQYYKSFEAKEGLVDHNDYTVVRDGLSYIRSNRTNTLEMLFEAEEMALLANETEQENDQILRLKEETTNRDSENDAMLKEHLNDPELMIKMLKAQKGI